MNLSYQVYQITHCDVLWKKIISRIVQIICSNVISMEEDDKIHSTRICDILIQYNVTFMYRKFILQTQNVWRLSPS